MRSSHLIPLAIYLAIAFLYLWTSTGGFQKGWTRHKTGVKGGYINTVLLIFVLFIVVFLLLRTTS